jgi:hypothetical protein
MNNIIKKNKLLGLNLEFGIPNNSTTDITLKQNQITNNAINNNLQKLVDNDIFIEKEIRKQELYPIGPKDYTDNISQKCNGYKMWNENIHSPEQLSILHKIDYELDDTIKSLGINQTINFIKDEPSGCKLIGTTKGLFILEHNKVKKTLNENENIIDCVLNIENNVIFILSQSGIYKINKNNLEEWVSIKKSDISNSDKLYIDNNYLYIYDENKLKVADYNENIEESLIFTPYNKSDISIFEEKPISINYLNDNKIIVTNSSIYSNTIYNSFGDMSIITIPNGGTIKQLIQTKTNMYVSTTKGLFEIKSDNTVKLIGDKQDNVYAYTVYDNKLYIIEGDILYKCNGE